MVDDSKKNPTAAALLIGDELLSGKIAEENGVYLIRRLRLLGVALKEIRTISDEIEAIASAVRDLAERYDYLITSGGVGPTHDDNTLAGVARAFGVDLVENDVMLQRVNDFESDPARRASFTKMARVPEGTTLIDGEDLPFPIYQRNNIYILPGIPEIFRLQFDSISERFQSTPFFVRTIYARADEGTLAPHLTAAANRFTEVSIGSYPVLDNPDYKVRMTVDSKQRKDVEGAYRWLVTAIGGEVVFKVVDGT